LFKASRKGQNYEETFKYLGWVFCFGFVLCFVLFNLTQSLKRAKENQRTKEPTGFKSVGTDGVH
jgi:hypothetical protein